MSVSSGLNLNSFSRGQADSLSSSGQGLEFGRKANKSQASEKPEAKDFDRELKAQSSRRSHESSGAASKPLPSRPVVPSQKFNEVKPVETWEAREGSPDQSPVAEKQTQAPWPVKMEGAGEVDPLTRRAAMQSFLRKMEDELGIDASEIVNAFSKLSVEELMMPPEQTVGRVLDQMGLEGEDRQKALLYFEDMLKKSASSSMAEYLKGNDRQISLEVLSRSEARKKRINESLDRMSQSFFVAHRPEAQQSESRNAQDGAVVTAAGFGAQNQWGKAVTSVGAGEVLNPMSSNPAWGTTAEDMSSPFSSIDSVESSPQQIIPEGFEMVPDGQVVEDSQDLDQAVGNQVDNTEVKAMDAPEMALPSATMDLDALGLDPEVGEELNQILSKAKLENLTSPNGEPSQAVEGDKFVGMSLAAEGDDLSGDSSNSESQATTDEGVNPQQIDLNKSDGKASFIPPTAPKMTANQEAQNVREVVDQAQVMVKNGGGEMKIKMNPEGVGEVTLKVATEGGRVNVEMIASNAETKKMLEKGLGDLKETLASHKLNVDMVKVGASEEISKHMDQQLQDQQSRFAQQFMEEFRQDNRSWRQGFLDLPGVRNYKSQSAGEASEEGLTPHQITQKRSGRRLDLVA